MKTYTEEEVKQLIKDTMSCTMRGMMDWYESEHAYIVDKTTKERIPNCELEGNRDISPFDNYIRPLLAEKGIMYTTLTP
jgi:hypothetical protein